tara:strand:- start:55 stop:576 length:522 start_codon:yes stop_codon:yes gene_type:complete
MKKVEYTRLINELEKGLSEQYGKDNVEVIDTDEARNNTDITQEIKVNDVRFPVEIKVTYNQIDDWKTSTNKYGHTTEYKAVAEMRSAHFEVSRKINDKVIERFVEVETVVRNEKDYFKFVTEITMDNILIGKEVQEIQTKDVYYSKKDNFSPLSQYVKNYVLGNGVTPNYNFS